MKKLLSILLALMLCMSFACAETAEVAEELPPMTMQELPELGLMMAVPDAWTLVTEFPQEVLDTGLMYGYFGSETEYMQLMYVDLGNAYTEQSLLDEMKLLFPESGILETEFANFVFVPVEALNMIQCYVLSEDGTGALVFVFSPAEQAYLCGVMLGSIQPVAAE